MPLSKAALTVIEAQPKIDWLRLRVSFPYQNAILGVRQEQGQAGWGCTRGPEKHAKKGKVEPIPNWTLHDLRRTAKTLMARAGVRPDISERVLGHVIAGVEGTYDRHSYADEKREALEKLATMIERILNPQPSNVLTLDERRTEAHV